MPILLVVLCSTRPTRAGEPVARWVFAHAQKHGRFTPKLVDLRELALPMLDEPEHPRLGRYVHEHTKRWSAIVREADAFVIVTPEYNYGPPGSLVNAISYLHAEWAYKPAGFVSYGGVSGGTRSAQASKSILTTLKVVTIPEAVSIPFIHKQISEDGKTFTGSGPQEGPATVMLDELARWTDALAVLRR